MSEGERTSERDFSTGLYHSRVHCGDAHLADSGEGSMIRDKDGYLEEESYVECLRSIREDLPDGQQRDDISGIIGALIHYLKVVRGLVQ